MSLTLGNLKGFVTRRLRGAVASVITSSADTAREYVNQGGRTLCVWHRWNWLLRPPATINLVSGQSWVPLPTDFKHNVGIKSGLNTLKFKLVDPAILEELRGGAIYSPNSYSGAIVRPSTAAPADPPRLELYPTPSANVTAALRCSYRTGWSALTLDADVANVPDWIEPLLTEIVVAIAEGNEKGDMSARLEAIENGPLMRKAVEQDGGEQGDLGPMTGGYASAYANPTQFNTPYLVDNPS